MKHNESKRLLSMPVKIKNDSSLNRKTSANEIKAQELKILVTGLTISREKCKEEFDKLIYKLSGKPMQAVKISTKLNQLFIFIKDAFKSKSDNTILSM